MSDLTVKRLLISAVVLSSSMSLVACSSGSNEASGTKTSATKASAMASGSASGSAAAAESSASIKNDPAARKDVTMSTCTGNTAGWSASGKVANAQKKDADYTIVVSFTDTKSTVLARQTAKVKVPAGGSADWKVKADFKAPADVVCVLRGVDRA